MPEKVRYGLYFASKSVISSYSQNVSECDGMQRPVFQF